MNLSAVLNIGLARDGKPHITSLDAIQGINDVRLFVRGTEVFESDTEPTLVATIDIDPHLEYAKTADAIYRLAVALDQDCIAVHWTGFGQAGSLIGPNAEAWGDFNPAFFIMPDGTRLG